MFDLSACHVERNDQQDYELSWRTLEPGHLVSIYMSDDPEFFYRQGNPGVPVLCTREERARVPNPDKSVRHYFLLRSTQGESAILAERRLSLAGTSNFRDLGGYQTECGRQLKWGKLYRSSKLSRLTEGDQDYVRRLGLTLVCDFRQVLEQELEPTLLGQESGYTLASLPISPGSRGNFMENLHRGIIAVDDASGFMEEMNRDFVASQLPQYCEMFQLILAGDHPTLIHCASGKDRTGFGAALILDVLGVEEDAIVEDYLLTNRYLPIEEEIGQLSGQFRDESGDAVPEHVLRPLLEVRPEYIRACFEEIRRHYASREHFYESALDLDADKIARLKDRLLH
ncbi:tyrosine-protein phosphatase [Seongchinamella sediminis]|uniref:Tyrosine-protein phosphatase n=1 Tax=Seongchinamella sediminis TaxID=2283635 RepID=A0A3L7DWU1_9GAMM|nr:tyrosine-protein phosphatase [Seongchinamella sediminis]RLQ22048.1 tyrosine-protein phosphatase [Seongchinamella sediminis]